MQSQRYTLELGGKTLTAEFTDLANQSDSSVLLRYGNTVILATVVMSDSPRDDIDYFPLSVEYEEKFYAVGQILGSRFMRREGRPSDEAVLSGRAVDRTLRPLFDHRMRHDVQVIITILSLGEDDPDVLAINAASLALATSDIPWGGPVGAVRIGKQNGDWAINPSYAFRQNSEAMLDLLVCGKDNLVNMIEVGAHEVAEETLTKGLENAQKEITKLQQFQEKIVKEIGKEKRAVNVAEVSPNVQEHFEKEMVPQVTELLFKEKNSKQAIHELADMWSTLLKDTYPDEPRGPAMRLLDKAIDEAVHQGVLERDARVDGRALDEVRPLFARAGELSSTLHGTGIFYRGGTHILSVLTLGGPEDTLLVDTMETQEHKKRFLHHYNFPPFSVGETGRVGGFNRRMIGHGALAEKALRPVIPPEETFPYTIRIVSEALASNGSTSMGSVCASSLALMDAGVPITKPVAGIAMGLIAGEGNTYKVLTDIQGPEDHHGDMDLKIAGTRDGITAIQMDVKVYGVSVDILSEAFVAARAAREQILDVIQRVLPEPRAELPENAPRVVRMKIPTEKFGLVIGSGGKTINALQEKTETDITLEDDGSVFITGKGNGPETARAEIEEMVRDPKVGDRYDDAEVARVTDFGAFVKIGPTHEGLVHISELAPFRIRSVSDVVSVGDHIPVMIKEIDDLGRINLSLKEVDPDFAARKGVTPATTDTQHPAKSPKPHARGNRKHNRRKNTNGHS